MDVSSIKNNKDNKDNEYNKDNENIFNIENFKSHQELGTHLKLFFFDEKSPGSAFFLFHGTKLYNNLVNYIKYEYKKRGYNEVITPIIYDKSMWKISGHWDKYKENMFVIECANTNSNINSNANSNEINSEPDVNFSRQFAMKPMNCCGHCEIFKYTNPSYRDLPMRIADFGNLHRNEVHGSLKGLTRVRKFCQDDAHIFCEFSQIKQEIKGVLDFIHKVYKDFNMGLTLGLSTRPDNFIGDIETWNRAEEILVEILSDYPGYEIYPKDGAFYGNKIDCKVTDAHGRKHQLATIQLDFNLPERFGLVYKDNTGNDVRPVMIHRAVFGSIERFIGILLESTQGSLPFFVNPRQIAIIPVKHDDEQIQNYCFNLQTHLKNLDYSVDFLNDSDTMQKKIANCEMLRYSIVAVIGKKEVESNIVNIRNPKMQMSLNEFDCYLENLIPK